LNGKLSLSYLPYSDKNSNNNNIFHFVSSDVFNTYTILKHSLRDVVYVLKMIGLKKSGHFFIQMKLRMMIQVYNLCTQILYIVEFFYFLLVYKRYNIYKLLIFFYPKVLRILILVVLFL